MHNKKNNLINEIDARRNQAIEFLRTIVSIPSVTGNEGRVQEFLADYLKNLGLEVDIWESDLDTLQKHPGFVHVTRGYAGRPNVVGVLKCSGGGRSLLLNGHTDVVPPGVLDSWSHDPWSASVRDGRLYGRGSSDMKSGIAAITMAVESFITMGMKTKGDILVNFVVDEEQSGNGTLDAVLRGYRADAGICCETSGLAVQPTCIGRIWWEIQVRGKSAGIQRRNEGVNAIDLGYLIVQAIKDLETERIAKLRHQLYPSSATALPCMVCTFNAGHFPSAFPDHCSLGGSMATFPGEDHDAAKQSLIDAVAQCALSDSWMQEHPPEVRFIGYHAEASEIPRDHPIVETVANCYAEISGQPAEISGREGASDVRFLNRYGSTPTVIFGPGSTSQMHATNEWVSLDDYIKAIKTIALSIHEWCGVSDQK